MIKKMKLISLFQIGCAAVVALVGCSNNTPIGMMKADAVTSASSVGWGMNDVAVAKGNGNYLYCFAANGDGTNLTWRKQFQLSAPAGQDMAMSWQNPNNTQGPWSYLSGPVAIRQRSLAAGKNGTTNKMFVFAIRSSDNCLVYRNEATAGAGDFQTSWQPVVAQSPFNTIYMSTSGPRSLVCESNANGDVAVFGMDQSTGKLLYIKRNTGSGWTAEYVGSQNVSNYSFCISKNYNNSKLIAFVVMGKDGLTKYCEQPSSGSWSTVAYQNLPACTYTFEYGLCAVNHSSTTYFFVIAQGGTIKYVTQTSSGWTSSWTPLAGVADARRHIVAVSKPTAGSTTARLFVMYGTTTTQNSYYLLKMQMRGGSGSWLPITLPKDGSNYDLSWFYESNSSNYYAPLVGISYSNTDNDASFYMVHRTVYPTYDVWSISGDFNLSTDWTRWGQLAFRMNDMPPNP